MSRKRTRILARITGFAAGVPLAVLLLALIVAVSGPLNRLLPKIACWTVGILLAVLLPVLLARYFGQALAPEAKRLAPLYGPPDARSAEGKKLCLRRAVITALAAFLISRLFFLAVGAAGAWREGNLAQYLSSLPERWRHWDAYHYIGLIENWYVNTGDPRFHIVFFPFYPLICRGLYLLGVPAMASAYLVSNLCLAGSGVALYALVQHDSGDAAAARAVWLLMFCPVSFFFSAPFTESVFLLTTLLAVLCARKRRFLLAVAFGALSANCRSLGMATAIPIFWEMLRDARDRAPEGRVSVRGAVLCVLRVLPVSLGLVAYLLLNRQITGDPLTFLTYQSEHWGQRFGSPMDTIRYTVDYAFTFYEQNYRAGVWWPQAVSVLTVLGLMAACWRRLHAGDAAYALVYFYVAIAPTWLLSGARYLGAMYALFPMLASATDRRWKYILALAASLLCGGYMAYQYVIVGSVM